MDAQSSASHVTPGAPQPPDAPDPGKKRRHRWIWVIVLLAFGLLFYWVIRHQQKSQQAMGGRRGSAGAVVPVTTAAVHAGDLKIYFDALGTVTPVYTNSITAQVTGVVTAVHYREGQVVRKGDALIDIDDRLYKAQLTQAEGALEHDQQVLAQAQMDLDRYQQAWAKNAIPRQTLEDQEKLVLQEQAAVKNDQGTVDYDQVQVGYCHITAPISGRVGLRLVDPGNLVTANSDTTLVVITQTQPITVVFTLAEDNLPKVLTQTRAKQALPVEAMDRSQSGHLATGKLTSIDNQIDTATGTVKLRAEFDNRDGSLYPNQFVNTRMLVQTLENQTLVPASAVQHNGSEDFVYVLASIKTGNPVADVSECAAGHGGAASGQAGEQTRSPEGGSGAHGGGKRGGAGAAGGGIAAPVQATCKAVMRSVKSGASEQGDTVILDGLKPGEVVADSSFEKLTDGQAVIISKIKLPAGDDSSESTAP